MKSFCIRKTEDITEAMILEVLNKCISSGVEDKHEYQDTSIYIRDLCYFGVHVSGFYPQGITCISKSKTPFNKPVVITIDQVDDFLGGSDE